jgi:hypothetical protein
MKIAFYAGLLLAMFIGAAERANAVSVSITHDPLPSIIHVGDIFSINFSVVSPDLGDFGTPSIKSYYVDISAYRKGAVKGEPPVPLLNSTAVTFSSYLGPGAIRTVTPLPSSTPTFQEASTLTDAALDLIQPQSFVILAVTFQAIAPGSGSFHNVIYNLVFTGSAEITKAAIPLSSSFTVLATPLPATLPLFASTLAGVGLLGWRRKKRRTKAA